MKKIIFGLVVMLAALSTTGCNKDKSATQKKIISTPESVVKDYVKACRDGDSEKCASLFYYTGEDTEQQENLEVMTELMQKGLTSVNEEKGGIKSFEIESTEKLKPEVEKDENGQEKQIEMAKVRGIITYGDESTEIMDVYTKKIDGKWYIDVGNK